MRQPRTSDPIDVEHIRTMLNQAIASSHDAISYCVAALDDLPTPIPPPADVVRTPEDFDQALANAASGSVIVCGTALVYPSSLSLTTAGITIRSETTAARSSRRTRGRRMTAADPLPTFTGGINIPGESVTLIGLEISRPNGQDIVVCSGPHPTIDRCRILGNPTSGQKRGIAANAPDVVIVGCYIDHCFGPYPGNDCQAICAWNTPGPLTMTDNYLCGSTETIMIGGGDPSSADNIPSDILISGNTITKRPEWQTQAVSVKNTLELKNARRVRIEHNEISYSWGGKGQDGYLLMLTPRNQDGHAPYSTVEDVIITENLFRCGAAAINILGADNNQPSQRMKHVYIEQNRFEQLDPKTYAGSNKMILIAAGPTLVTIHENDFVGINIGSQIYFTGSPDCEQLTVTDNVFPSSKYGVFGDNCSTGNGSNGLPNAWNTFVASGAYSGNTTTAA